MSQLQDAPASESGRQLRLIDADVHHQPDHQQVLARCVAIMCDGMSHYQRNVSLAGLADPPEVDRYCYFVAGVVGEMLTELFSLHCGEIAARRMRLLELAPSFGEGLQLTNILKDIWDDRARGACWLPRAMFARHGVDIEGVEPGDTSDGFSAAMEELIGMAHAHLDNAFEYALLIPPREAGVRRFCLWAIGLALLTLRRIRAHPDFRCGAQVKVSRPTVRATTLVVSTVVRSDTALRLLYRAAALRLPREPVGDSHAAISQWERATDRGRGARA